MKKLFLVTLISALLTAAVFAEPKTYVIDLGDSDIKTIEVTKNPYGTNYQNVAPAVFTKYFKNSMPVSGDTIEVHYKLTSDVDLPALTLAVIDNSQKANYWLEISSQYQTITGIKAGEVAQGVFVYKVKAKPIVDVTVQFLYDDKIDSKLSLQKVGVKTGKKQSLTN